MPLWFEMNPISTYCSLYFVEFHFEMALTPCVSFKYPREGRRRKRDMEKRGLKKGLILHIFCEHSSMKWKDQEEEKSTWCLFDLFPLGNPRHNNGFLIALHSPLPWNSFEYHLNLFFIPYANILALLADKCPTREEHFCTSYTLLGQNDFIFTSSWILSISELFYGTKMPSNENVISF